MNLSRGRPTRSKRNEPFGTTIISTAFIPGNTLFVLWLTCSHYLTSICCIWTVFTDQHPVSFLSLWNIPGAQQQCFCMALVVVLLSSSILNTLCLAAQSCLHLILAWSSLLYILHNDSVHSSLGCKPEKNDSRWPWRKFENIPFWTQPWLWQRCWNSARPLQSIHGIQAPLVWYDTTLPRHLSRQYMFRESHPHPDE